ncbi:MAG: SirB2 family protein [Gammaproteobacteria bacterium]
MLKLIHVSCALISISGFVARGLLALQNSPRLAQTWIKVTPHLVDTVLLVSAILLLIQTGLSPLQHSWLAMKILLLVLYIVLGLVTLRLARTRQARRLAFVAAVLVFAYIVVIAENKSLVFFQTP